MKKSLIQILQSRKSINVIVGLVYFAIMGMVGVYTIVLATGENYDSPVYLPVRLKTAENLKAGATVYVLGVPSGVLHSRSLVEMEGPESSQTEPSERVVVALLMMRHPIRLYENYRIETKYMEILGEKVVEIQPGYARHVDPKTGRVSSFAPFALNLLQSKEATRFQMEGKLPESIEPSSLPVADNFDDPLYLASALLQENREGVRQVVSDLADITDKLDRSPGTIAKLANSPELLQSVNGVSDEVKILVGTVRDLGEALRETDSMVDLIEVSLTRLLSLAL